MIGGEPLDLVGDARPHIDLLNTEHQRRPDRLAMAGIEHSHLHPEHLLIPIDGARHVGDIDHDMIERVDLDRHGQFFRLGRPADAKLEASRFVCYNASQQDQPKTNATLQGENAWLYVASRWLCLYSVSAPSRSRFVRRPPWTTPYARSASWSVIRPAVPPIFWRA